MGFSAFPLFSYVSPDTLTLHEKRGTNGENGEGNGKAHTHDRDGGLCSKDPAI